MAARNTGSKRKSTNSSSKRGKSSAQNNGVFDEVLLVLILAVSVLLLFSTFGLLGTVGKAVGNVLFGIFGMVAYLVPFFLAFALFFSVINKGKKITKIKIGAAVVFLFMLCAFAHLIFANDVTLPAGDNIGYFYRIGSDNHITGGFIGGTLSHSLKKVLGTFGAVIILLAITVISGVLLTERSFWNSLKRGGENIIEDAKRMKDYHSRQAEVYEIERRERDERATLKSQERELQRARRLAMQDEKREASLNARRERAEAARLKREENAQKLRDEQRALYLKEQAEAQLKKKELEMAAEAEAGVNAGANAEGMPGGINPDTYSDADAEENDSHASPGGRTYSDEYIIPEREPEIMTFSSDTNRTRRVDNKVSGVISSAGLFDLKDTNGEMREIIPDAGMLADYDNIFLQTEHRINLNADAFSGEYETAGNEEEYNEFSDTPADSKPSDIHEITYRETELRDRSFGETEYAKANVNKQGACINKPASAVNKPAVKTERPVKKSPVNANYKLPPINLLNEVSKKNGQNASDELKETGRKLKETFETFGVNVSIIGSLRGPSVTRYEIQPELGVKVSKIVSLTDDIKLALAATDIRMEAPIPGKSAIGIEIPNRENTAVAYRELVESRTFKDAKSKISFAVGKDLNGQVVVSDIAKMPHVLIAGATGSGKSVCINTLIMSILYKATPDEVRLIMIDPKVVELSVYNGIPHLLLPVVTDPKKASASLQWAVNEMMRRYQCFADLKVRDMAGYNKLVTTDPEYMGSETYKKMPQIVIIVDELADLMMVAAKEVEEAICRLAQLARAAGIHLILATQRPSVDVITGLIKANMPSRIAFSVSSGVDSRTILDMVGAEKLLGKGDMLFYPQGYTKPARVQGAFVSDEEVKRVVDFLSSQVDGDNYDEAAKNQVDSAAAGQGGAASSSGGGFAAPEIDNGFDPLFYEAGKSIIEKDKASIGLLQRLHKIGFNRAARIMDQLADAGVVGAEEGTKPRKVLMTIEEFEAFIKENNQ